MDEKELQTEFSVGDLVMYKEPRRFFSEKQGLNIVGLVTEINNFFARIQWSDGLWCLESFEDLNKLD